MTNIALVVLDTLRKDRFDDYFGWLPGLRFEQAYSAANWTVPSHAAMFTGYYPSEVGVHAKHTTFDYPGPTLAETLSEAGYRTRGFSANMHITGPLDFDRGFDELTTPGAIRHLDSESIFDWQEFGERNDSQGVQKYIDGLRECISSDVSTIRSLIAGVRFQLSNDDPKSGTEYGGAIEATEKINEMSFGDDEFLFLNLMEAHEPYSVPDEYQTVPEPGLTNAVGDILYGDDDNTGVEQAYDDCAQYLSDQYEIVFELLTNEFDYIITVSDHGEMLGERGMWGHEYGVSPELVHVPLVISGPEIEDGQRHDPVSLVDITATVQQLAGVPSSSDRSRPLLDSDQRRSCLSEYCGLSSWSEQALNENGYSNQVAEYDKKLRGVAIDSGYFHETMGGLSGSGSSEAAQAELNELVDSLSERSVSTDNGVPDELKDHLKDLGYA
ncbi:arylsulfatase [Haloferax prahovense DSM 18310]|uniref:Arylsulfatase n=1 Tax=Haloferax prahovense (strain DSM 18310 / JCM 13924 / TL6) TaxID=1227461 RepID=M0G090_HALPT|nr:sulfatase-like hydrolase/transferase [Haloferax prahovense]ELZ65615.1 arylsulfatase [Haloferax prahovense DSM 18310]